MNIENYDVRSKLVDDITTDIANRLVKKLKDELVIEDKVVTGGMSDSLQYYKEDKIVGSTRDGMDNIEYGRTAGNHVPIEPLKKWAKIKFGLTDGEAYGVAKKVEQQIFENGIPMTRFAKITLEKMTFG